MTYVLPEHLKVAIGQLADMSMSEKEAELDIIYREQPNMLASVLVQQKMGNSLEQIEVLLHILLVIHLSLREAGVDIATVSEAMQEQQLRRLIGRVKFTEDLNQPTSAHTALSNMIDESPEKWLYAYTINEIQAAGFLDLTYENSKYLALCGLNLVNCINPDY